MKTRIIASGSYLPSKVVTNDDFAKIMDTSDEWISQRTGIKERRFEEDSNAHMASYAAIKALENIDYESIDCIIAATYTPDSYIPGLAAEVRKTLNIRRPIPTFDLNAACSGFIFALETANAYIKAKIYKRILVVGSDMNSKTLDFTDRSTSILFGDGAGAVVLEASDKGIIDTILGGEIDRDSSLSLKVSDMQTNPFTKDALNKVEYFEMNGSEVFKFAVRVVNKTIKDLLTRNKLSIDDIDYVVSHQANQRILNMAARSLKTSKDKFLTNLEYYGNTSSASVPILLDESLRKGIIKENAKIIVIAFGGGLSYGASLIEI
ncbi:MAG: ketoacyl-ACP synthase III [Erysipelothrix sp.]|nr:ketoacyl-ACP synthase III [Erysipelothrix sp.]